MNDQEIIKSLRQNVGRKDDGWTISLSKEVLDKKTFLHKLKKDKAFKKQMVNLVEEKSIAILNRRG